MTRGVVVSPAARGTSVQAGFQLAPRLELRLAF
jgi:hypothetical protein